MSKLSRREKRVLLGLCVISALPLGITGFFAFLEADPNIQIPPRPPMPSPNGFDLYVQAAKLTAQPNPPIDALSDVNAHTLTKAQSAERYNLARREAWNEASARGWELFKRAQQAETRLPFEPGEVPNLQSLSTLRILGRNKVAQANLHWMRGERDAAVRAGLDVIELSVDLSNGGSVMERLVSDSILGCGMGVFNNSER